MSSRKIEKLENFYKNRKTVTSLLNRFKKIEKELIFYLGKLEESYKKIDISPEQREFTDNLIKKVKEQI